jgi:nitrite reductase (NO-forming)
MPQHHEPRARRSRAAAPQAALAALLAVLVAGCGPRGESAAPRNPVLGGPPAKISFDEPRSPTPYSGPGVSLAPEVAPAPDAPAVDIHFDVTHTKVRVDNGVEYVAWTFGGVVPGPVIHVRQGTRIRFSLTNRSDETASLAPPMPHSIDFHAAMVNPVDKYQSVGPGGTIRFEWTANYPGVFMYHCATPSVLHHISAGMFGMVIVDPRNGFPGKVDREYALVQSELYLSKTRSGLYAIDSVAARAKRPTYVAFNGRPRRHVDEPLKARAGERVRLYVLNAGPNGTCSFHVIGTILDRVWIDGNPANERRGQQTVLLPASGAAIVEFVVPEDGIYTFVDHEFADAEMGATGHVSTMGP